jgi:predicted O-linked N-acetylglucosamine transferase (SPINDLY family)
MDVTDHLARYRAADLVLDTFPYNAHTTASDALWMGVPMMTRMGNSFASRVAASILRAAGLPELVTTTLEAYRDLALELATNPRKLADVRERLARNHATAPLFDTAAFTRNLEELYLSVAHR